jgi:hypothetical protein
MELDIPNGWASSNLTKSDYQILWIRDSERNKREEKTPRESCSYP